MKSSGGALYKELHNIDTSIYFTFNSLFDHISSDFKPGTSEARKFGEKSREKKKEGTWLYSYAFYAF